MRHILAGICIVVIILVVAVPATLVSIIGPFTSGLIAREGQMRKGEDITIRVYMHETGAIVEMGLEEYVKGVVAAEMPAEFHMEALKSQAVAARTFAVKSMRFFGGPGLPDVPGADVSSDFRVSQAWTGASQAKERWGLLKSEMYWQKIKQAVDETQGLILTYKGEPIHAVFHSTSGGKTASADEVWGSNYPYLQSVECVDRNSPRYQDKKEISLAEAAQQLGTDTGIMAAAQNGAGSAVQVINRTASGRVSAVRLGNKTFTGQAVRDSLGLRSTNFNVEVQGDRMVFTTFGYGHGVGLSQYGSNGMAKEGRDFRQIVAYFYPGTALKNIYGS